MNLLLAFIILTFWSFVICFETRREIIHPSFEFCVKLFLKFLDWRKTLFTTARGKLVGSKL